MNANKGAKNRIKRDNAVTYILYWINNILYPPAKVMFILWTLWWMLFLTGTKEISFGKKFVIVLFGYIFMCGIADLFYAANKKRYLDYKVKITQKKVERLQKIMFKLQYGYDKEVTKKGFIYKLFHREPSAAEVALIRVNRAKQLANIINSTYNFEEFINSYEELIRNMEFLQSIEYLSIFTGRKPSEDLAEIRQKRPLAEKEFVNRYMYQCGKESLEFNKNFFNRFLPETVQYINMFIGEPITKSNINKDFDYMDGHDFEYFCADILRKNGFESVEVTQGSGDHGVDILAEKDGITYAIQCKCYASNIGNAAVQQAHTGKSIYHKDIAVVLTNRYFTAQATEEAKALGVKLWDRDKLTNLCRIIQNESESGLDPYFIEAGKLVIENNKASIGMLQRTFKIGFNRAAGIMNQLADAGVVGEEEGTKPRKILMSIEDFKIYFVNSDKSEEMRNSI